MLRLGPHFFSFLLFFGLAVLSAAFLLRLWLVKKGEYRLPFWFFGFGSIAAAVWCVYAVTAFPVHIPKMILHTDTAACFLFAGGAGYLLRLHALNRIGKEKASFDREFHAKVFFTLFFFFSFFVIVLIPSVRTLWLILYPPEMVDGVIDTVVVRGEIVEVPKSLSTLFVEKYYLFLPKDWFTVYAKGLVGILAAHLLIIRIFRAKVKSGF